MAPPHPRSSVIKSAGGSESCGVRERGGEEKEGSRRQEGAFNTHIDLDRHDGNNSLRRMLNADQDDEDELRGEVEHAALDHNGHCTMCNTGSSL